MVRLLTLLLFLAYSQLIAQKINEETLDKAKELSREHKDDNIVGISSTSMYSFFYDKKSDALQASHEEEIHYMAIRSNASYIKRNYYNDKSYIKSYAIKSLKGKSFTHDKFCGHYQSGDIFYSDAQVCAYKIKTDVQGQELFFSSETVYTDPRYLTKAFFHDEMPVLERKITVTVPEWANVELVEMNFTGYEIEKSISNEGGNIQYSYKIQNVEKWPEAKNSPGILHFLPHILILTKSYTINSNEVSVLASTEDLYAWYHTLVKDLSYQPNIIEEKVQEVIKGKTTSTEKIEAIYYWVQDNIKYIAFENGLAAFKPELADKVLYNRYGDCKGMANLTKTMLQLAGFDARLAWIGTNKIPYTYDIPSLAVDNHMICAVYADGKKYILDPTEKYNPLDHHAERIQGKQILIEDGSAYFLETVQEEEIEDYLQENRWSFELSEGSLSGRGSSTMNGELKKNIFHYLTSLKTEDLEKFLQAVVSGSTDPGFFKIGKYSEVDRKLPFTVQFDMDLSNNHYNKFGNEVYLDLDFVKEFKGQKVEEERIIPYSFGEKKFTRTTAEINIPGGYEISYLPGPYTFENDYFKFSMKYTHSKGKITYKKEIQILQNVLPVAAFDEWNTTIDEVTKFFNDQIILKVNE